jgi:hypothetical protein
MQQLSAGLVDSGLVASTAQRIAALRGGQEVSTRF